MTSAAQVRMTFRFELAGEKWNWPVAGEDAIKAFRELLQRAEIEYEVVGPVHGSEVEWLAVKEGV